VYVRSGGKWIAQAIIEGRPRSKDEGENEGFSVALSADGNTAIFGAPQILGCSPSCSPKYGETWVFTRSPDGLWSQQAKLVGIDIIGRYAYQGYSVSLSGDGNTAIVGGPLDNYNDTTREGTGAAWVFARSTDGAWTEQAKLIGGGFSVSLSYDGNSAIVGNTSGAVGYVRSPDGGWSQDATFAGTGARPPASPWGLSAPGGFAVSLSANGNTAMVGTSVFIRSEEGWIQQVLSGTGAVGDAAQGFSVSLSADGHTSIVGAPRDNNDTGAAWVYSEFVLPGTPGKANCYGKRISGMVQRYGGLNGAAAALGFSSISELQDAAMAFCEREVKGQKDGRD
jgi:hypothetical protein